MATRLISADSHVSVQHDQVKAHLASKYHDAYDDALTKKEMLGVARERDRLLRVIRRR